MEFFGKKGTLLGREKRIAPSSITRNSKGPPPQEGFIRQLKIAVRANFYENMASS